MRICNNCNRQMIEGFCIGDGESYLCSEKCYIKTYGLEDWQHFQSLDADELDAFGVYYTEWEHDRKECETCLNGDKCIYQAFEEQ